ncbi:hypothetical protein CUMW_239970 [Citrus unshiu]|uniref:Histidine-containing phosphotransfer protein n=1 Tax=Citrus unshiu TaxID=55188 RepID=A0A2H5QL08_CITUN|nr:hypothetical protein CUMW_239970 [Citrus unshiu]
MERNQQLRRQLASMRQSLFDQELQDDANPNFVEEVVTLHYRDSARLITTIERALEKSPLDFNKLDGYMHQFKGSSTSIGAKKVKRESTQFRGILRGRKWRRLARQAGPNEIACRPKNGTAQKLACHLGFADANYAVI